MGIALIPTGIVACNLDGVLGFVISLAGAMVIIFAWDKLSLTKLAHKMAHFIIEQKIRVSFMTNPIVTKFGKRVRELRKSQGLSQQKLALKTDLHYTYIGAVERGERNLYPQSMEKIAKGLGVNIAGLFPFPQTLSPEAQLIEKIVNLLRQKDLEVLQLVLKIVKAVIEEYHH